MRKIRPEVVNRRIESFENGFGKAHLYLAYHAAFPLALTPDLLYRLWANFQRDINGEMLNIPWIAVADLLLSSLCDEVGHELYEMDLAVRNLLLSRLQEDKNFGQQRIYDLSDFLLNYVKQKLQSDDYDIQDYAQNLPWIALAYTRPNQAAYELALAFSKLDVNDKAELVRLASLTENLAEPLVEFQPLLSYSYAMGKFARGNLEAAKAELGKVLEQGNEIQIAEINLPIPKKLKAYFSHSVSNSEKKSYLTSRKISFPYLLLIGGAILLVGLAGYTDWQSLPLTVTGHEGEVNSLAFSPTTNILADASDDRTIKIWNLNTRKEILTLKADSGWVYTVVISPDGQSAIAGYQDNTIKIWNLNTGEEIRTLKGHRGLVNSVAISPDGQTVVSGSSDKTIKIWDFHTGKEIRTLKGHTGEVLSVAISPNGDKIASASADRTIKVWQLTTGQEIHTIHGHALDVNALAISPNGQMLLSASDDKTIKLWNLNTGKPIRSFEGHTADVNAVAFSPNGEYIASGSDDKTVKVWQLNTGEAIHTFKGHSAEVYAVAFSPDGKTLVSGSKDKTIKVWQLQL